MGKKASQEMGKAPVRTLWAGEAPPDPTPWAGMGPSTQPPAVAPPFSMLLMLFRW